MSEGAMSRVRKRSRVSGRSRMSERAMSRVSKKSRVSERDRVSERSRLRVGMAYRVSEQGLPCLSFNRKYTSHVQAVSLRLVRVLLRDGKMLINCGVSYAKHEGLPATTF